jgi:hypothetical protein
MSDTEVNAAAAADYQEKLNEWNEAKQERLEIRKRYATMLGKVISWEPPTPDHEALRTYMMDQLQQSIDFDTKIPDEYAPKRLDGKQWHSKQIKGAIRSVAYAKEQIQSEKERNEKRYEWIADLYNSLEGYDD